MTMGEMTPLQSVKNVVTEKAKLLTKEELAQFPNLLQEIQKAKTKEEVFKLAQKIHPLVKKYLAQYKQHLLNQLMELRLSTVDNYTVNAKSIMGELDCESVHK